MKQPSVSKMVPPALMTAGAAFLVFNDAIVKHVSGTLPIGQIIAIRSFVIMIVCIGLAVLLKRRWTSPFQTGVVFRTVFTVLNVFIFVKAVSVLPFALAVLLSFTNILYVAILAPIFLTERLDLRKVLAVSIGFLGAWVTLSPEIENYGWLVCLPLLSAFFASGREILTRRMGRQHSAEVLTCYAAAVMALAALFLGTSGWIWDEMRLIGLAALAGLFLGASMILMTAALQLGEATVVSPFLLTSLIWTILLAALSFGETIGASQIAGSILIAVALLVLVREKTWLPFRRS